MPNSSRSVTHTASTNPMRAGRQWHARKPDAGIQRHQQGARDVQAQRQQRQTQSVAAAIQVLLKLPEATVVKPYFQTLLP